MNDVIHNISSTDVIDI